MKLRCRKERTASRRLDGLKSNSTRVGENSARRQGELMDAHVARDRVIGQTSFASFVPAVFIPKDWVDGADRDNDSGE
jgi:hypothetical protein